MSLKKNIKSLGLEYNKLGASIVRYIIKIFDTDLVYFNTFKGVLGEPKVEVVDVNNKYMHLMPPKIFELGIESWLKNRIIPKNREFVESIVRSTTGSYNYMGIIDVCLGLSVTDSYWIVREDFKGHFDKYNLFDNKFNKALQLVAFTGYERTIPGLISSPELTAHGMMKKCWRRIDNKVYLYKGGTFGFANSGQEPYSEYYAAQIAEAMGLKHVEYDIRKFKGELASVCELFTSKEYSLVPIWLTVNNSANTEEIIRSYGREDFASMITLDAVICNTDRHLSNFGLLRDNHTGQYESTAPLFDHGLSLFNFAMTNDFRDIDRYAKTRINSFGLDQVESAKTVIGTTQRRQLRKLIGFEFKRHKKYNLEEWRLKAIEEFIQRRVRELMRA